MSFKTYDCYKESGIAWLGKVPATWKVVAIKHGFDIKLGKMLQPDLKGKDDILLPYIRAANIQWKGVDASDIKLMWFSPQERAGLALQENDLLVSEGGDVGRACLWRNELEECYFQNSVNRARSKPGNSPGFGRYWLSTLKDKGFIDVLCNKSTIAHFTAEKLAATPALLPPYSEQVAIASFLDRETTKIDALIAEQQRLIELLQEKRQAVISHAVTKGLNPNTAMKDSGVEWLGEVPEHWEVAQLKYFSKSLPGFAFPSDGFVDDEDNWKLLRGVNVGVSSIRWDDAVYWERAPGDGLDRYELSPGDLVVGLDRPLIKEGLRVARIKPEDCPCMLLQRVAAVKGVEALSTDYLFYLLSSPFFAAHFEPETTGVSVPHISTGQIDSFVVPIPPPGEQAETVRFLSDELADIQRLVDESKKSSEILQERRSALISAAVTGQIDVRGLVEAGADER